MSYLLNSTPHFYSPQKLLILLTHRYSDPSLIQYFAVAIINFALTFTRHDTFDCKFYYEPISNWKYFIVNNLE